MTATEQRVRTALSHIAEVQANPDLDALARARNEPSAPSSRTRPSRTGRRSWRVPAAAAALLLASTGVAVGTGAFTTEDGPNPQYESVSQFRDMAIDRGGLQVPFAPPHTAADAIDGLQSIYDRELQDVSPRGIVMDAKAATNDVAMWASCSWLDNWRTATLAGDDAAATDARSMIDAATSWDWWALVNRESQFERHEQYLAAIDAGDVEYITYQLSVGCPAAMTTVPSAHIDAGQDLPDGVVVPTNEY